MSTTYRPGPALSDLWKSRASSATSICDLRDVKSTACCMLHAVRNDHISHGRWKNGPSVIYIGNIRPADPRHVHFS